MTDDEKIEILQKFATFLIQHSEDIPIEFAEIVQENFWDLI